MKLFLLSIYQIDIHFENKLSIKNRQNLSEAKLNYNYERRPRSRGHLICAKALISLGANLKATDMAGETAYRLSKRFNHTNVANYLYDSEDSNDNDSDEVRTGEVG